MALFRIGSFPIQCGVRHEWLSALFAADIPAADRILNLGGHAAGGIRALDDDGHWEPPASVKKLSHFAVGQPALKHKNSDNRGSASRCRKRGALNAVGKTAGFARGGLCAVIRRVDSSGFENPPGNWSLHR